MPQQIRQYHPVLMFIMNSMSRHRRFTPINQIKAINDQFQHHKK